MIFSPTTRHNIAILLLASTILTTPGASGADSSVDSSWDGLVSSLSHEDNFGTPNADDWYDQCIQPFADLSLPPFLPPVEGDCITPGLDCPVSNYQLHYQPSGLCMGAALCGYEKCIGGPDEGSYTLFGAESFNSTIYPKEQWVGDDRLDLPKGVVHPIHVGDISAAIKYAAEHKIEISVKNAGHSYTGSSTKKNSLLLKLSKLKKYSFYDGSIVNCQVDPDIKEGAYQDACDYAIARNKPAVIRVGGGELWDEVLRAIYLDFNDGGPDQPKYHIVSGAAGTVAAAGGWLASGGLGATQGMRLYGLGIDQVLHVEMVLPNGVHVRFGPTEWEKEAGKMYPTTTHVKGYCNVGDLSDEDLWDWQECSKDIDFHGLWFAVRGGGGGSYGVITSIYYQLHDYSPMDFVVVTPLSQKEELGRKWVEFVLRFMYLPESVGVTELASNSCSSPDNGGFKGGIFICFNGAGSIMRGAWERFYSDDAVDFSVHTMPSWAHFVLHEGTLNSNVPEGRAADIPKPLIYPSFKTIVIPFNGQVLAAEYMVFPIEVFLNKLDLMVEMIFDCTFKAGVCTGNGYFLGGKIPSADDGMSSLSTHRRHGAFNMLVSSPEWRTKFKRVFYGVEEGEAYVGGKSFPGEICHNHASANYPTALKDDWTQGCNPSWDDEMKKEKCLSYQEASWGTDILMKLQDIHAAVDPDNLFNCWDCVGNAPDMKKGKKGKKDKKKNTVSLFLFREKILMYY